MTRKAVYLGETHPGSKENYFVHPDVQLARAEGTHSKIGI